MTEFNQDLLAILQPVKGIVRHMNENCQKMVQANDLSLNELLRSLSQVHGKCVGDNVHSGILWSRICRTLVLGISRNGISYLLASFGGGGASLGVLRYRVPSRLGTVSLCVLLCLGTVSLGGCSMLQKKPLDPSHQLRSEASGSTPAGWDDRARQIESNLGVR